MMAKEILSQEEVLELLGIERKTLYTYRKEYGLPCYKIRGKVFFKYEEVMKWLENFKEDV